MNPSSTAWWSWTKKPVKSTGSSRGPRPSTETRSRLESTSSTPPSSIELKPTSLEKQIFPAIVAGLGLFAMVLPGFWMDIGQPSDYIAGLRLCLASLREWSPHALAAGAHAVGNALVHESAAVGEGCLLGPDVAVGSGRGRAAVAVRGDAAHLHVREHRRVALDGRPVGGIENMMVLGEDVNVRDEVYSNGGVVMPQRR